LDEVAGLGGLMALDGALLLGEVLGSDESLAVDGSPLSGEWFELDEALETDKLLALDESPELCMLLELEVLEVILILSLDETGQRSLSLGVLVGCVNGQL
jgi:hypothetical protein